MFRKIKSTPSHISFSLLGVRVSYLKPSIKKERKRFAEFYQSFANASLIPPAEGNLRIIQKANVELLNIFHSICEEKNLQYWIDFGTLLGAVRHKGFIPWDDDIDLGMPRDDYEKLISLFSEGLIQNDDLVMEYDGKKEIKKSYWYSIPVFVIGIILIVLKKKRLGIFCFIAAVFLLVQHRIGY